MRSKSLFELASKALCARNLCSSLPRSTYALKIAARACLFFARGRRSYCSSLLRSHYGLQNTARACFKARMHSKSPSELAYFSLEVADATARACFEAIMGSKTLLELASKQSCTQNHCSTLLIFWSKWSKPRLTYPSESLLEKTARVDYTASNCTLYEAQVESFNFSRYARLSEKHCSSLLFFISK